MMKHSDLVFSSLHEWLRTAVDYEEAEAEEDDRIVCSVVNGNCEAPAGYLGGGGITDGEGNADYECDGCGEPVCGECSQLREGRRLCDYCDEDWG